MEGIKTNMNLRNIYLKHITLITVCVSVLFSVAMLMQDRIVNDDGMLYLVSADFIKNGDWVRALEAYRWPFYPFLISILSTLSTFNVEVSAHILNAILLAGFVLVYIAFAKTIHGSHVAIVASAVILLNPVLNEYRSFIIRDHGYILFLFLGLHMFYKYIEHGTRWLSLAWSIPIILALLFRIEALIFLFAVPLFIFLGRRNSVLGNIQEYLLVNSVSIFTVIILLAVYGVGLMETRIGEPTLWFQHAMSDSAGEFIEYKMLLETHLLNKYLKDISALLLIMGLLSAFVIKLVQKAGILAIVVAVYSYVRIYKPNRTLSQSYIIYVLLINIGMLFLVFMQRHYITGRYALTLSLLLTILAMPVFQNIAKWLFGTAKSSNRVLPWRKALVWLSLVVVAADGLVQTGSNKNYVRDAAEWINSNRKEDVSKLYTNNETLRFYVGIRDQVDDSTKRNKVMDVEEFLSAISSRDERRKYSLAALQIRRLNDIKRNDITRRIGGEPTVYFQNRRRDAILIYDLRQ